MIKIVYKIKAGLRTHSKKKKDHINITIHYLAPLFPVQMGSDFRYSSVGQSGLRSVKIDLHGSSKDISSHSKQAGSARRQLRTENRELRTIRDVRS